MPRERVVIAGCAVSASALLMLSIAAPLARADGSDGPPIAVTGGYGGVDTSIRVPGSSGGSSYPIVQPAGGGSPNGSPAVTCSYILDTSNVASHPADYPGLHAPGHVVGADGSYYYRYCTDGSQRFVWAPRGVASVAAGVPTVTPAQLAVEARDRLVLTHPAVHRSPDQTLTVRGDPYTYPNLWTWYWTNPADYKPLSHTLSVGPLSATVTAKPVGLLFDPADGSRLVVCDGPGREWMKPDDAHEPPGGCGYQYRHATDRALPARVGIVWRVSWTGTAGTGGTLPAMETFTRSPLRVLQIQTVTR